MTVHAAASAVAEASHSVWWPTRKWWAATIVAFGRLVAYVVKNDDTPGNVPNKRAGNGRG